MTPVGSVIGSSIWQVPMRKISWRCSAGLLIMLPVAAGCAMLPTASVPLSGQDQQLYGIVQYLEAVSFADRSPSTTGGTAALATPAIPQSAYRLQDTGSLVANTLSGFYVGPFPATPSALPGNYAQRPVGGWLTVNPQVTVSGTTTTTDTYWTPGGDSTDPAALTETVMDPGQVRLDLYAAPSTTAALPTYFASMLSLPVGAVTQQAAETYTTYHEDGLDGTALGYRWAVNDANDNPVAYIRAFQVTQTDGSKVDRWVLDADYSSVNGVVRPLEYGYQTYYEGTQAGESFDQTYDPGTGLTQGSGSYKDIYKDAQVAFKETLFPDGSILRIYTYTDPTRIVVVGLNFDPDGSGTGYFKVNGKDRGHCDWDKHHHGHAHFESGDRDFDPPVVAPDSGD